MAFTDTASIPSNYSRLIGQEPGLPERDRPALLRGAAPGLPAVPREDTLLTARQQLQILGNARAGGSDLCVIDQ